MTWKYISIQWGQIQPIDSELQKDNRRVWMTSQCYYFIITRFHSIITTFVCVMNLPYCLSMGYTTGTLEQQQLWFLVLLPVLKSSVSHVISNVISAEEMRVGNASGLCWVCWYFPQKSIFSFPGISLAKISVSWGMRRWPMYCFLPAEPVKCCNISKLHLWASETWRTFFLLFPVESLLYDYQSLVLIFFFL